MRPERALEADRVLSMATVDGPRIGGLPRDPDGFLPVDHFGRVDGAPGIWAAGEVTSFPVRQPGLGAQQAHVVAASIAAHAGAEIVPEPFRPVLEGRLHLCGPAAGKAEMNGHGPKAALLWWPPEQLAGKHLLAHIGEKLVLELPGGEESIPVSVELGSDGRVLATDAA